MEHNKEKFKYYKIVMLVVLTAFITFLLTSIIMYSYMKNNEKQPEEIATTYTVDNIDEAIQPYRNIIDKYYLGEIDENALIEGAIKGYVDGLNDPYTEYISKEEMQDYTEDLLGNFVGIGVYMVANTEVNRIQVLSPIKDSPAEKAGIQPGDYIIKVNDVEYTAEQMTEASNVIKGEEGTTVKLQLLREDKTLDLEITREEVETNPLTSEVLENNIGYIGITSFDENSAEGFKKKLEELQKQNISSLIIDLRNNGGGIVDEAIEIAECIVDKDSTLLITTNKDGKEEITKSDKDPIINMPIVVLVNENSASASEILAGALKDLQKATLVGTTTYGKGVIQNFMTLRNGSGIKVTTEEYFTPNRQKINEVGIEPNEVVELPEDVQNQLIVEKDKDTQLQKAIELLKK